MQSFVELWESAEQQSYLSVLVDIDSGKFASFVDYFASNLGEAIRKVHKQVHKQQINGQQWALRSRRQEGVGFVGLTRHACFVVVGSESYMNRQIPDLLKSRHETWYEYIKKYDYGTWSQRVRGAWINMMYEPGTLSYKHQHMHTKHAETRNRRAIKNKYGTELDDI